MERVSPRNHQPTRVHSGNMNLKQDPYADEKVKPIPKQSREYELKDDYLGRQLSQQNVLKPAQHGIRQSVPAKNQDNNGESIFNLANQRSDSSKSLRGINLPRNTSQQNRRN